MSASKLDVLGFAAAHRTGSASRAERSFFDFTLNAKPLKGRIPPNDHIGVFGWQAKKVERSHARVLLGKEPSPLGSGDAPLYVCPECADLGCGVISVTVTFHDDCVVWSDIGWDPSTLTPRSAEMAAKQGFEGLRDFWFDRADYVTALARFL